MYMPCKGQKGGGYSKVGIPKGQAPPRGSWTAGQSVALKHALKKRGEWKEPEEYAEHRKKQAKKQQIRQQRKRKKESAFDFFDNIISAGKAGIKAYNDEAPF